MIVLYRCSIDLYLGTWKIWGVERDHKQKRVKKS